MDQYYPNVSSSGFRKLMIHNGFLVLQSGLDLNVNSKSYGLLRLDANGPQGLRQTWFLSTRGVSALVHS